jgi:hypothetical protein
MQMLPAGHRGTCDQDAGWNMQAGSGRQEVAGGNAPAIAAACVLQALNSSQL